MVFTSLSSNCVVVFGEDLMKQKIPIPCLRCRDRRSISCGATLLDVKHPLYILGLFISPKYIGICSRSAISVSHTPSAADRSARMFPLALESPFSPMLLPRSHRPRLSEKRWIRPTYSFSTVYNYYCMSYYSTGRKICQ